MDYLRDLRLCAAGLSSSSRPVKISALNDLQKKLENTRSDELPKDSNDLLEVFRSVIALFQDPSEAVQEKAVQLFSHFIDSGFQIDGSLPILFDLLRLLLGDNKIQEESEEIRLVFIVLLENLCGKKGDCVRFYIDDLLAILEKTLTDPFADVRVAACRCLVTLIPEAKSEFSVKSDPIIDVLIATFSHNQAKVRAANTQAMGFAIHFGNQKRVVDVWRLLAQRVLDSNHLVRKQAFSLLHFWMSNLRDRYSYWTRLVPLLLSGLFDELPDIRTETLRLWTLVGQQYYEENREEIKKTFFEDEGVDNCPLVEGVEKFPLVGGVDNCPLVEGVEKFPLVGGIDNCPLVEGIDNCPLARARPTLGCRVLVQRIFFNLLPSILNDLKDWQPQIRIQTIRLLFQMILHAEGRTLVLLDKIFPALSQVAKFENESVVAETISVARLIGHFIEPKIICELLVERMEDASHLVILFGILQGVEKIAFRPHADAILNHLYRLSWTSQKAQQFYCLQCVRTIISLLDFSTDQSGYFVFRILATIKALSVSEDLKKEVLLTKNLLADHLNLLQPLVLHAKFAAPFLTEIIGDGANESHIWLSSSVKHQILQSFLLEAGLPVFLEHFEILYPVLKMNLQATACVRVRFDIYRLLMDLVQKSEKCQLARSQQVNCQIIQEIFFPNMAWKAGRSNTIARAACCCCLAIFLDHEIIETKRLSPIKAEMMEKLVALSRDECQETQRATVRLIRFMINLETTMKSTENSHQKPKIVDNFSLMGPVGAIKTLYPVLLKGLDESAAVRFESLSAFSEIFTNFANFNQTVDLLLRPQLEEICRVVMIHLDEPNDELAMAALDCLKCGTKIARIFIQKLVEQERSRMKPTKNCNLLHEFLLASSSGEIK